MKKIQIFTCSLCGKEYKSEKGLLKHNMHLCKSAPTEEATVKDTTNLPTLIKCGKNYIDPTQVSSIREVKNGKLYIVRFKDEPNPEYPCWIGPEDIENLLSYFNIKDGENI